MRSSCPGGSGAGRNYSGKNVRESKVLYVWHIVVGYLSRLELFRGNCLGCKGPKGSSQGDIS